MIVLITMSVGTPLDQKTSFLTLILIPRPHDPPSPPDATPTAGLATPPSRKSFEQLSSERAARIARLKEQKQLEKKLEVHTKQSQHVTKNTEYANTTAANNCFRTSNSM